MLADAKQRGNLGGVGAGEREREEARSGGRADGGDAEEVRGKDGTVGGIAGRRREDASDDGVERKRETEDAIEIALEGLVLDGRDGGYGEADASRMGKRSRRARTYPKLEIRYRSRRSGLSPSRWAR